MEQWPEKWLILREAKGAYEPATLKVGSMMRKETDGSLTYLCECGSSFNRFEGEDNDAAQAWVELHSRPFKPLEHTNSPEDLLATDEKMQALAEEYHAAGEPSHASKE